MYHTNPPSPTLCSAEAQGLTDWGCWSSQDLTIFIHPYNNPLTDYAFTFLNVNLSTSAGDYGKLMDLIRKKLHASSTIMCAIATQHDNIPVPANTSKVSAIDYIINSTHISGLMVTENSHPAPSSMSISTP